MQCPRGVKHTYIWHRGHGELLERGDIHKRNSRHEVRAKRNYCYNKGHQSILMQSRE